MPSRIQFLKKIMLIVRVIFTVFLCFWINHGLAVKLPPVYASNMVIQRNTSIDFWGYGEAGEKIILDGGWLQERLFSTTGDDGIFHFSLATPGAGGPYSLHLKGESNEIDLEQILVGDVWVCSGQSNMDFTINMLGGWKKSFPGQQAELMKEGFESIRLFSVEKDTSSIPKNVCGGSWQKPDTLTVSNFSATAWFFGVELHKALGIPIGLVVSAWGGTPAEAWTPSDLIQSNPNLAYYRNDPNRNSWFPTSPGILYNAMILPLTKIGIKGATWYQGESNVTDAETYDELFSAMIKSWRDAWNMGDFPFYFVQIAPFTYERAVVGALLREAQMKSMKVPESGMVVTMDITDDVTDIHPRDKVMVGKRLALWALSRTYHQESLSFSGPVYSSIQLEGKVIRIGFDHAEKGLRLKGRGSEPVFFIAGPDRHFVPARVKVRGGELLLWSSKVREPVAVRYAFSNTATARLFNSEGLPASSFRTDEWPVVTEMVHMKPLYDRDSGRMLYELQCTHSSAMISYSVDGSEPSCAVASPSGIKVNMQMPGILTARACVEGIASESIGSWEINQHKGVAAKVSYRYEYAPQYSAGGEFALVDGVDGSLTFNDGAWQGFEGDDLSIVLDLGESTLIRKVQLRFFSDPNSWIFLPRYVEIKVSQDGVVYDTGTRFDNPGSPALQQDKQGREIVPLYAVFMKNARFLKVTAKNIGVCPPGHKGAGDKAWLFIDELKIE